MAASDVDWAAFRELALEGENLYIERKRQLPEPEALGAVVASMANMLGGWLVLGVTDSKRELVGCDFSRTADLQSHIGNLLRGAVDPVPPFRAERVQGDDGLEFGFIRVFSASRPVLVRGKGALYTRDDGGKVPVSDHRVLLDLARRGQEAEDEARTRAEKNNRCTGRAARERKPRSQP